MTQLTPATHGSSRSYRAGKSSPVTGKSRITPTKNDVPFGPMNVSGTSISEAALRSITPSMSVIGCDASTVASVGSPSPFGSDQT